MKGLNVLRICLDQIAHSHTELTILSRILRTRPPKTLEAVEDALVAHLVDTEEALAHVRRMRVVDGS